jgi:2-amino-4-hydroxy-6-hydroxymethyldihydropteridine diphosphokinase
MGTALIGLGSNLGDRSAALGNAVELLQGDPLIRVEAISSFRPSKPVGGPEGQREFLNAAVRLETSLSPEELLAKLQAIENQIGRVRVERWGPRTIDLDLLLYDQVELKSPSLELPHPRMCYRRFVLEPAAEIAAEMVWPVNGWSVRKLIGNLDDSPKFLSLVDPILVAGCDKILAAIERQGRIRALHKPNMLHALPQIHDLPPDTQVDDWLSEFFLEEVRRASHDFAAAAGIPQSPWMVGGCWLKEFIELSPIPWLNNSPHRKEKLRAAARKFTETAPNPRLLIVLVVDFWQFQFGANAESVHSAWTSGTSSSQGIATLLESWEEYWSRVRKLIRDPASPPSYWLPEGDHNAIASEVLAAMQAME